MSGSERARFKEAFTNNVRIYYSRALDYTADIDQLEKEYIVEFFANGLTSLYFMWILNDCKEPEEIFAEAVAIVLFKGSFIKTG